MLKEKQVKKLIWIIMCNNVSQAKLHNCNLSHTILISTYKWVMITRVVIIYFINNRVSYTLYVIYLSSYNCINKILTKFFKHLFVLFTVSSTWNVLKSTRWILFALKRQVAFSICSRLNGKITLFIFVGDKLKSSGKLYLSVRNENY